jgi:hypothetical protein
MHNDSHDERYKDTPDDDASNHQVGDSNEIKPGNQLENEELSGASGDDIPDFETALSQRLAGIDMFSETMGDEEEVQDSTTGKQDSTSVDSEDDLSDPIEDEPTHGEKPSEEKEEFSLEATISDRLSDLRMRIGEPEVDEDVKIPEEEITDENLVSETGGEVGDIETTLSEDETVEHIEEHVSSDVTSSEDDVLGFATGRRKRCFIR